MSKINYWLIDVKLKTMKYIFAASSHIVDMCSCGATFLIVDCCVSMFIARDKNAVCFNLVQKNMI